MNEQEPWDHDRQCRIAWCRVNGDRAPVAFVARELGVSETTLGVMLERGRAISVSPLLEGKPRPKKPALVMSEDDLRAQFREQMARARAGRPS